MSRHDEEYEYEFDEEGAEAPPRSRIYREAFAILILAASLFCFLSLLSYRPVETPAGQVPTENPRLETVYRDVLGAAIPSSGGRGNLCGPFGDAIASALLASIGTAAYLLVGLITFWAMSALIQQRLHAPLARLFGGAILIVAFAALATFVRFDHYGGWLGAWVHARMAQEFSLPGSYLLLLSTTMIGVLLSTDWLPLTALGRVLSALRQDTEDSDEVGEDEEDEEYDYEDEDEEEYEYEEEGDEEEVDEDEGESRGPRRWLSAVGGALALGLGRTVRASRNALAERLRTDAAADNEDLPDPDEADPAAEVPEEVPAPAKARRTRKAKAKKAAEPAPSKEPAREPTKEPTDESTPVATGAEEAESSTDDSPSAKPKPAKKRSRAKKAPAPEPTPAENGTAAGDTAASEPKRIGMIGGGVAPKRKIKMNRAPSTEIPDELKGERTDERGYTFPPIELLDEPVVTDQDGLDESIRKTSETLVKTLADFRIEGEVVEIDKGPVITLYEVELAAGIRVQKVANLTDDLAMALKSPVRIVAPIPGKSTVGIEVPNQIREMVGMRELAVTDQYGKNRAAIPFLMGKDASGNPVIEDLAAMPHMLIAGATGSGKSICINTVILSILISRSPDDVQLILIDPKMVELSLFKKIPHLLTPVITDMKKAPAILEWAVNKMEERYALLADVGVKNISGFNQLGEDYIKERAQEMDADPDTIPTHLPYIVIIVDELADLMMIASKEIEGSLTRLAQKSRAVGIHIIFATQRPSVDVVTGLIKANLSGANLLPRLLEGRLANDPRLHRRGASARVRRPVVPAPAIGQPPSMSGGLRLREGDQVHRRLLEEARRAELQSRARKPRACGPDRGRSRRTWEEEA